MLAAQKFFASKKTALVDDDKQVGTLKAFPSKNLWKKIVSIFEDNGLMAVENEDCIELGW